VGCDLNHGVNKAQLYQVVKTVRTVSGHLPMLPSQGPRCPELSFMVKIRRFRMRGVNFPSVLAHMNGYDCA
jgi:hypothetical protein